MFLMFFFSPLFYRSFPIFIHIFYIKSFKKCEKWTGPPTPGCKKWFHPAINSSYEVCSCYILYLRCVKKSYSGPKFSTFFNASLTLSLSSLRDTWSMTMATRRRTLRLQMGTTVGRVLVFWYTVANDFL